MISTDTTQLQCDKLLDQAAEGARLSAEDALLLYEHADLHRLGAAADTRARAIHGNRAFYGLNRHINYTNICVLRCAFCPFCRRSDDNDAYTLTLEDIVNQAGRAVAEHANELHIVGGLHPTLPYDYYVDMIRELKRQFSQVYIKAYTAVEIAHFARLADSSIEQVLNDLRSAGLDALTGGGAEIFDDRVHDEGFRHKIGQHEWFDIHRCAHTVGLVSNATMLFGHIETPSQRISHLAKLRTLQDETGGFRAFVGLPFVPDGSAWSHLPGPTAVTTMRTMAVARLVLDNIAHIKAFWVMMGIELAQVLLRWGADDLEGTVGRYDITHVHDSFAPKGMSRADIERLIREVRLEPCIRNGGYTES